MRARWQPTAEKNRRENEQKITITRFVTYVGLLHRTLRYVRPLLDLTTLPVWIWPCCTRFQVCTSSDLHSPQLLAYVVYTKRRMTCVRRIRTVSLLTCLQIWTYMTTTAGNPTSITMRNVWGGGGLWRKLVQLETNISDNHFRRSYRPKISPEALKPCLLLAFSS